MKTLVNRFVLFAAAALADGTLAYGQTQLKAEIPFSFRTPNATLPAGTYIFDDQTGTSSTNTMKLWNTVSQRGVLTISSPIDPYRIANSRPSVVFACRSNGCSLSAIKTSNGTLTYHAGQNASRNKESVSAVSIPLTSLKSE